MSEKAEGGWDNIDLRQAIYPRGERDGHENEGDLQGEDGK